MGVFQAPLNGSGTTLVCRSRSEWDSCSALGADSVGLDVRGPVLQSADASKLANLVGDGLQELFLGVLGTHPVESEDNGFDQGIISIITALPCSLRVLDLSGQFSGPAAVEALAKSHAQLTTLDVSFNRLTTASLDQILQAPCCGSLSTLRTGWNALQSMPQLPATLANLWIGSNPLVVGPATGSLDTVVAPRVPPAGLHVLPLGSAKHVDISYVLLGPSDLAHLHSVLFREGSAAFLDVTSCDLGDQRAARLVRDGVKFESIAASLNALTELPSWVQGTLGSLSFLQLSHNELSDRDALAIASGCGDKLRHLDLGVNGIGDTGFEAVARQFTRWTELEYLFLRSNIASDKGVSAVAESMSCLDELVELHVCWNLTTSDSTIAVAQVVAGMMKRPGSKLQLVDLFGP
mmetsp:Transcript_107559/g.246199  ORF Transcript_107559/g.246199 Transcript_107559/m.246199 type:complete len:407 (-) Transcript_107559:34-1254(-)